MIRINLAFDEEIAKELADYLINFGIDAKLERSEVKVNKTHFDEKILSTFLEKTNRTQYTIQKINTSSFLISKIANAEDLG